MSHIQPQPGDAAAVASAAEQGRRSALALVEALRSQEAEERRRWIGQSDEDTPGNPSLAIDRADRAAVTSRLQAELEHLRHFRLAVVHSKGWRVLQFLRRLVGRAW